MRASLRLFKFDPVEFVGLHYVHSKSLQASLSQARRTYSGQQCTKVVKFVGQPRCARRTLRFVLKKHFTTEDTAFYFVNRASGAVNNMKLFSVPSVNLL